MRVSTGNKLRLLSLVTLIALIPLAVTARLFTAESKKVVNKPHLIYTEHPTSVFNNTITAQIDSVMIEEKMRNQYVETKLKQLTLEEKVGQMFIWRAQGTRISPGYADLIKGTHAGGIIMMGNNISGEIKLFSAELQGLSPQAPLFIAVDQEGGIVKRINTDPNPGPPILAKMPDDQACSIMQNTSKILKSSGINLNFGLIGDIAWNTDSYMTSRAYGNTAEFVSNKLSKGINCSVGTLTTVKHYPGHGRTSVNSHKALPEIPISYDDWMKSDAIPFKASVDNGVDMVMTGHLKIPSIDDKPASLSRKHIEILRKLGFQGVVVTDDLGMLTQSHIDPYYALDNAIEAGSDLLLYVDAPASPQDLYNHVLVKVRNGEIPQDRINESVKRILIKKYKIEIMN